MLKKFIVILLLIILLQGCDSTEPPIVENEPLIPLSVGNYWLYQDYLLNPETGEISSGPGQWKFGFIVSDTLSQTINGQKVKNYIFAQTDTTLLPINPENYSIDWAWPITYQNKNGFYFSGTLKKDTIKLSFNDLIFSHPARKGEILKGHRFYYSTAGDYLNLLYSDLVNYSCISTDSIFQTSFGDFSCVVFKQEYYEDDYYIFEVYYFIKPGLGIVGMVQMSFYKNEKKQSYFMKYVLTDYKLN